jgi:hypothetical protein
MGVAVSSDELADLIADEIKQLVIEYHGGRLACDLDDACVELACDVQDHVTRNLTAAAN